MLCSIEHYGFGDIIFGSVFLKYISKLKAGANPVRGTDGARLHCCYAAGLTHSVSSFNTAGAGSYGVVIRPSAG